MQKLCFEREINKITIQADELAIWITCAWTLPISKAMAIEYVEKYNTDPNAGFFSNQESVILSHNGGKITFTQQEAKALIKLIKIEYL